MIGPATLWIVHACGIALAVLYNRLRRGINPWISSKAAGLGPLTKQRLGNPATWLHHGLVALALTVVGGFVGLWVSHTALGFAHWATGMWLFYMHREMRNWRGHTRKLREGKKRQQDMWSIRSGWKLDGIMDTVGPLIVMVVAWALVL